MIGGVVNCLGARSKNDDSADRLTSLRNWHFLIYHALSNSLKNILIDACKTFPYLPSKSLTM